MKFVQQILSTCFVDTSKIRLSCLCIICPHLLIPNISHTSSKVRYHLILLYNLLGERSELIDESFIYSLYVLSQPGDDVFLKTLTYFMQIVQLSLVYLSSIQFDP